MAAKVFLTGASGYIGGEVLHQLFALPTKHQIRCLVRDKQKAALIQNAFPLVEISVGDLEDEALIEEEARKADVVFHLASTRHEASSRAIVKGLSDKSRQTLGYWIQIGGASVVAGAQVKAKGFGEAWDKTYNDVKDIDEIRSILRANPARIVENLLLDQTSVDVKTALILGPIIYGNGRGPVNTNTIQGPAIADYTIKNGEGFQIGKGLNVWSTIHVADIGNLFILLFDAAIKGQNGLWNEAGIYLPENGHISFGEFGQLIAQAAKEQGLIQSANVKSLTAEKVDTVVPHGSVILGTTAHTSSSRANEYLGWRPRQTSLRQDIPLMVKQQAVKLSNASGN